MVLVRKKGAESGEQMTKEQFEAIPAVFREQFIVTVLEVEKPESVKAIEKELKEKK